MRRFFPAISGVRIKFRGRFYGHRLLLYLSVALRVLADFEGMSGLLSWAGLLNALAVLLFIANNVTTIEMAQDAVTPNSTQVSKAPITTRAE